MVVMGGLLNMHLPNRTKQLLQHMSDGLTCGQASIKMSMSRRTGEKMIEQAKLHNNLKTTIQLIATALRLRKLI